MRTIVIGDVHGCYEEVLDLFDACAVSSDDRIIFAGDLVDRGPKPRECVELAMRHEAILGNHEEKHLNQRRSPDAKLSPDHLRTRRALEQKHYDWFETLPLFIELEEATVVHAGAMPNVPIPKQDPYHLLHAQCIKPPAKKSYWPSKAPEDHTFWTNHWKGPERLIFGHTVLDKPLVTDLAVGIDTGCCHGRSLTAIVLPGWTIVSVPSRQAPDPSRTVGRYRVHAGVMAFS